MFFPPAAASNTSCFMFAPTLAHQQSLAYTTKQALLIMHRARINLISMNMQIKSQDSSSRRFVPGLIIAVLVFRWNINQANALFFFAFSSQKFSWPTSSLYYSKWDYFEKPWWMSITKDYPIIWFRRYWLCLFEHNIPLPVLGPKRMDRIKNHRCTLISNPNVGTTKFRRNNCGPDG